MPGQGKGAVALCRLMGRGASPCPVEHLVSSQWFLNVCFSRHQAGDAGG